MLLQQAHAYLWHVFFFVCLSLVVARCSFSGTVHASALRSFLSKTINRFVPYLLADARIAAAPRPPS